MTVMGTAVPAWRRFTGALGMRLVLLFLVLALALTAVFTGGMQRAIGGGWRALVRPLVADYVDRLADELGAPPDVERAKALVERLPLSVRIQGPAVNWDSHPHLRALREQRRGEGPPWLASGPHHGGAPMHRRMHPEDDDAPDAGDDSGRGWLLLTRTTADGHTVHFGLGDVPWRQRPRSIGWFTLALLLGLTAVAYAVMRHWLRPLGDIRAGAVRYGQGQFDAPIPVRGDDELGRLAGQINTMAGELRHMLDAKRALLLSISHELRSPLTRARLNAELVEEGPSRDALLRDLGEMRELISDLLESERLAAGHAALQREPVDLAALVEVAVHEQVPADVALTLDLDADLGTVAVDPARWRLLVRNLVGNALRHGQPPLHVRLAREGDELVFTVRDHGPGVAPEALAQLGEAFYRPDAARGRSSGGVGLGLYLCRLVAQAHGGRLVARAAEPGLVVSVRMPVAR
ncbi:HAMP domain-containing sensor histidine kinase [Sphaerotilus sp.]|uniref:HAMP domain-containing sensor histidine kinase n=1 Tax=Sphaerotilus sp. TaxID=2093942 RepID=UPI002ACD58CB|nr:HAMP domain-containing sensor histidine kinase [Sphaerotilus sp.]MDZ7855658.1 HAMP domain-containing sensor histidine kinase [Sphaerotilus sp.]